jgi:hypothetical protein
MFAEDGLRYGHFLDDMLSILGGHGDTAGDRGDGTTSALVEYVQEGTQGQAGKGSMNGQLNHGADSNARKLEAEVSRDDQVIQREGSQVASESEMGSESEPEVTEHSEHSSDKSDRGDSIRSEKKSEADGTDGTHGTDAKKRKLGDTDDDTDEPAGDARKLLEKSEMKSEIRAVESQIRSELETTISGLRKDLAMHYKRLRERFEASQERNFRVLGGLGKLSAHPVYPAFVYY